MSNAPRSPHREALYAAAASRYVVKSSDSPVDTPKFFGVLDAMVEVAAAVCNIDQDALARLEILSAGMRSVVVRCVFGVGTVGLRSEFSVVAKHYRRKDSATNSGGFGFVREISSLPIFEHHAKGLFCALLGSDSLERITVTEDFVDFDSVHVLLTGGQLERGLDAYLAFFEAIYAQDRWHTEFEEGVRTLDGEASSPGSLTSPRLAIKGWRRLAAIAGSPIPELLEYALEINTVPGLPVHTVLTHGDFSPHNLAVFGNRVRAFDAEGAAIHHAFLPVADMMLGFPLSPHHRNYLPLVDSPLWQDACEQLYALATRGSTSAALAADIHVSEQILMVTGMVLELEGFTARDMTEEHRALLERTAKNVRGHFPGASKLIEKVLAHKSL